MVIRLRRRKRGSLTIRAESELHIFPTTEAVGRAAAELVAGLAAQAGAERGRFTVALSGGSLTKILGPWLVAEPWRTQIDWPAWHVFWADERCVPLDHPDSNYRLAREYIFDHVNIPPEQIYTLGETLEPASAATLYQSMLAAVFKPAATQLPRFDLILLGLGEDGHTASLFPRHRLLRESQRWVAPVFDSPKPPPERITLTLPVINNARQVAVLAAGAGKADILARALGPAASPGALPVQMVRPGQGRLHWFVDEAAAAHLKPRV